MNFYHILPSNTSSETFPKNHASSFSTPIENPYILNGKWEVALINLQHSNCVYTFDNDKVTVLRKAASLSETNRPVYYKLSPQKLDDRRIILSKLRDEINAKFQGMIEFKITDENASQIKIRVLNENFFIHISHRLRIALSISDIITKYDSRPGFSEKIDEKIQIHDDDFIAIVPTSSLLARFIIKKQNEEITIQDLARRFNAMVKMNGQQLSSLSVEDKDLIYKKLNSDYILLFNQPLHHATGQDWAGFCTIPYQRVSQNNLSKHFHDVLYVDVYTSNTQRYIEYLKFTNVTYNLTLERNLLNTIDDVLGYLNERFKTYKVSFSCNEKKQMVMDIRDEHIEIEFTNDLRDIFAFDKNSYKGKGVFTATGSFSLTRRIQYLYVYSNVSDTIHIGNTQAPLLAVIPFNKKDCKYVTERTFKIPMYVTVIREHISQIDVGIYDDAGKLIPFHEDAITTLRLHFRQVSL